MGELPIEKPDLPHHGSVYLRLLLPVYLPGLCLVLINTSCLILLPVYLLERGEGAAVASLALAMRGIGILVADGPAGIFANRFGDKRLMVLGGLCALLAMGLLVLSDSTPGILIASGMIGVSTGMSLVGRLSYLADVCKADERGRATSMVGGIQRVGALGGPILFSLLATSLGYSLVFAAMGVLALLNVVLVAAFVNYRSYPHREAVPAADIFRLIVEFRQVLLTAGSAGIVLMLLRTGRQTLFPIAGFALGLGLVEISLVFSVSMLIDMLLFYPAGLLMDKHGRKWAAVPGMLLLSISIFCLVIVPGLPGLWLFALISGIGNGITSGVLLTLATDLAPDTQRSQFIGIWRTQLDTGVVAAPALIGYLTDTVSLAVSALCISGLGLLGTCLLAFLVQETLVKEVPQIGTTG